MFAWFKDYKKILPLIHFLATFVWERYIFNFTDNWDFMLSIARNNVVSDKFELILTYIISKIFCLFIVIFLWKAIFFIIDNKSADCFILGIIFFSVLISGIIMFPELFGSMEMDNYTNYAMAVRFIPTYWQGIYTGTLYAGCLMVIPHTIGIFILQWFFFFSTVCYIFVNTKKLCPSGLFRYIPLVVFLLPESYYLTFNAYRNNYYTVLLMFYIAFIFFAIKKVSNESRDKYRCIMVSIISAFLMVWRSEGVLVGVCGIIVYIFCCIGISKENVKKVCLVVSVTLISFVSISSIQNIGAIKYYGKDYMIINTTPVLHNIFNDPNANFSYKNASEDLENIEAVVPVEVLRESGMSGYRDYNYTNGHLDFNQSLATDEEARKYVSSYFSIILHNPTTYLDVQINFFLAAFQFDVSHSLNSFQDEKQVQLESFNYDQWRIGREELMETYGTRKWNNNGARRAMSGFIKEFITLWREIIINSGINAMLHALLILTNFIIMIREILNALSNKIYNNMAFSIALLFCFAELFAVLLFMPDGRAAYLYPMLYSNYIVLFLYILNIRFSKEN